MSMECLSICLCPFFFPWVVVYSCPLRGPSHSLLVVFLVILFLAIVNGGWLMIWLSVCYWYIGMPVISAYSFCILRFLLKLLISLRRFGLRWWGLLNIQSCHLLIETIWLPPFLIEYPLFLFLAWLLWLELPILYWLEWWERVSLSTAKFKRECFRFLPIQ